MPSTNHASAGYMIVLRSAVVLAGPCYAMFLRDHDRAVMNARTYGRKRNAGAGLERMSQVDIGAGPCCSGSVEHDRAVVERKFCSCRRKIVLLQKHGPATAMGP